jgi:hypothetical protein
MSQIRPLAIDLFCGLGGWAEGFLSEGWDVIGFDIERHDYGTGGYPGQLVLQDVTTLHGSQFRNADIIVASPPCQAYSYRAMPWKRAKALPPPDNTLFETCFRLQREASEAAGRYIPLVVENVKGAQKWVGRARWHYGSFYLWGDVPALMPITFKLVKVGRNFHQFEKTGVPSASFNGAAHEPSVQRAEALKGAAAATKNNGGSWFNQAHNTESGVGQNPVNGNGDGTKQGGDWFSGYGGGFGWDHSQMRQHSSKSKARKAASAQIAKIPFPLAQHIARVFKPTFHVEHPVSGL